MRVFWTLIISALMLCAPFLSGCKQSEGERCQLDSDCEEGLICCVTPQNRALGGMCYVYDKCDLTPDDGGTDAKTDTLTDVLRDAQPGIDTKPSVDTQKDLVPEKDTVIPKDTMPPGDQTPRIDQSVSPDIKKPLDLMPTVEQIPSIDASADQ